MRDGEIFLVIVLSRNDDNGQAKPHQSRELQPGLPCGWRAQEFRLFLHCLSQLREQGAGSGVAAGA